MTVPFAKGSTQWPLLAVWLGMGTGLLEWTLDVFRRVVRHRITFFGEDLVWMAPLAEALLFLGVAVLLLGVTARLRELTRHRILLLGLFTLASWSLLTTWGRLHWATTLLGAGAIGFQGSALLAKRPWFLLLVRKTLPVLLAATVLLGVGLHLWRWQEERRSRDQAAVAGDVPNVLLIILDTVRGFNLSLYGYDRTTTPRLIEWAARGIVFDRALAASSWTLTSHASLFTGRLPHELGANWGTPLDRRHLTLAEDLKSRGYVTAGFVANKVYASRATGLSQGFTRYEDYEISLGELSRSAALVRIVLQSRSARDIQGPAMAGRRSADRMNHSFLRWLDDRPSDPPFFAFINYMDAHHPWFPPAPFDTAFGADPSETIRLLDPENLAGHGVPSPGGIKVAMTAYDAAIAYLDDRVGNLLDSLREKGVLENTIVIVTSDHGEEFGEHGRMGHGVSLFRQSLQVPLVMWLPGGTGQGTRIQVPVTLQDLPATVMALTGYREHSFPGRPWPVPGGGSSPPRDTLVAELTSEAGLPVTHPLSAGHVASVSFGGHRFIQSAGGQEWLFDFERDPEERHDLAPVSPPALLDSLRAALRASLGGNR